MPKVLCLPGFAQTAAQLQRELKPVTDQLEGFEFHYLNAPLAVPGVRDFDYLGNQTIVTTTAAPPSAAAASATPTPDSKAKGKALAGAVLAESIRRAAQAELISDQARAKPFADGKWAAYLRTAQSDAEKLIAHVPEVKDVLSKLSSSDDPVEALEKMAGRTKAFARTWSLQGHAYKGKGEWIGYSASLRTIASYIDQHGPFDGCIGFSVGGQLAWVVQSLLTDPTCQPDWTTFSPPPKRQPPFKFILSSSAIDLVEPNSLAWLNAHLPLPSSSPDSAISLMLWDASNAVIPAVGMWSFYKRMKAGKAAVHPGPHALYTKGDWAAFYVKWLKAAASGDREAANKVEKPADALEEKAGFPPKKDKGKL